MFSRQIKRLMQSACSLCLTAVSANHALAQDAPSRLADIDTPKALVEDCLARAETGEVTQDSCIGTYANICAFTAFSTVDMLGCMSSEADVWEVRLAERYEALLEVYAAQDAFEDPIWALAPRLENAQAQWRDWRDAKCGFEYDKFRGGSMGRITGANCRLDETAKRALELETLLEEAQL
ncbi:MAG: lysozyme inhibitor LprI family protein [Pseudomonadota bacterium]